MIDHGYLLRVYCQKEKRRQGNALRALIVVGALVLFLIFMFLGTVVGAFSMITTLLAFGSLYGGYLLITSMNIEYEYIVTMVKWMSTRSIAKRKRKRMLTVNARSFEKVWPIQGKQSMPMKAIPTVFMPALLLTIRAATMPC